MGMCGNFLLLTDYHELGVLYNTDLISCSSEGQKSEVGLTGLNQGVGRLHSF